MFFAGGYRQNGLHVNICVRMLLANGVQENSIIFNEIVLADPGDPVGAKHDVDFFHPRCTG